MKNKKKTARAQRLAGALLVATGLYAGAAFADDYAKSGQVGLIHARTDYDEFLFMGEPDVCISGNSTSSPPGSNYVPSDWRKRVRLYRDHPGYETISRMILSAKLAGAQVKVIAENSATNSSARCVLRHFDILE